MLEFFLQLVIDPFRHDFRDGVDEGSDHVVTKAEACHFLDRCDSTLSKWAQRGILVPIRRGGQLYYRKSDVMKMYKGEL